MWTGLAASQAKRKPDKSGGDVPGGLAAGDGIARNLRCAAPTPAMVDRHLADAKAGGGGAHLHFQVPAVGRLTHVEAPKCLSTHGPERRHVGEADAIDEPQECASE